MNLEGMPSGPGHPMGRAPWCSLTIIKGRKQPQEVLTVIGCREATPSWTPRSCTLSPLHEHGPQTEETRTPIPSHQQRWAGAYSLIVALLHTGLKGCCCPTSNTEEAEAEWFYEDLQDLLELTPKKDVLFIIGDWNLEVGSQEISGVTGKFGLVVQNEAGQRLIEFCQENALVIVNILFQQHKGRLNTWTSPNGQYRNQINYILCS